jgi:hypothetical protein
MQSWVSTSPPRGPRWERLAVVTATGLAILGIASVMPRQPDAPLERAHQMNAEIARLPKGTVVFNAYVHGGWLEWRHRNVVPVVDGMTDAYEVRHVADFVSAWRLEPGWYDFVRSTGADYALLNSDAAINEALQERNDWQVVVEEDQLVLLSRTRE